MRDENEVTVKDMAIGAVALFICYKLLKLIFGNSNEKKIDPMYVMSTRPSAVYVANTIEECQYAVTVLKSYVIIFIDFCLLFISFEYLKMFLIFTVIVKIKAIDNYLWISLNYFHFIIIQTFSKIRVQSAWF